MTPELVEGRDRGGGSARFDGLPFRARVRDQAVRMIAAAAPTLLLCGGVLLGFGGIGREPDRWGSLLGALLVVAGAAAIVAGRRAGRPSPESAWAAAALAALATIFTTDLARRSFFHLDGALLQTSWPWFLAAGALVARWLLHDPDRRAPWLLVAAQAALVAAFFDFSQGSLPTRDDHPSFLYRFHLLQQRFPDVVFYNPEWNAGYVVNEIVGTGALTPFLLALPFFPLAPAVTLFAAGIPYFFVVLVPWIFYAALRLFGVGRGAAALAAIVAIAPTTVIFVYELVYGIYPFVLSCPLAVLATALFCRLFAEGRGGWPTALLLVAATSLCLFWPMAVAILAPLLPAGLWLAPRLRGRQWALAAAVAAGLLAVNLPWVLALDAASDAASFVVEQKSRIAASGIGWLDAARTVRRIVEELHPLTLVLFPAGLWLWPRDRRFAAGLVGSLAVWALVVAAFGQQFREHVGLERFPIPLAFFLTVAAAMALDRLLRMPASALRTAAVSAAVATILLGAVNAAGFLQSRSRYPYQVLPPDVGRALAAIRADCPDGRRVLVPGFSLHWFGGGHIAPLPALTGRSFVGNDFYHRRDYNDAVPRAFRDPVAIGEFLERYDAGCVLAWSPPWIALLEESPHVERLHDEGWLRVYAARGDSSRFLRGSGTVSEEAGRLLVETSDEDVVIRYRWVPGLRATPPVPIEAFPVDDGLRFIRLRPSGAPLVEIRLGK